MGWGAWKYYAVVAGAGVVLNEDVVTMACVAASEPCLVVALAWKTFAVVTGAVGRVGHCADRAVVGCQREEKGVDLAAEEEPLKALKLT